MTPKPLGRKMWFRSAFSTDPQISPSIVFDSESDFEAAAREIIYKTAYSCGQNEYTAKEIFDFIWPALKKKLLEGE